MLKVSDYLLQLHSNYYDEQICFIPESYQESDKYRIFEFLFKWQGATINIYAPK